MNWKINLDKKDIRDLSISALLFILSYAPSPFGFLIYFAFIPLFNLFARVRTGRAVLYAYFFAAFINTVILHWIAPYSPSGFIATVIATPWQFVVVAAIFSFLYKFYGKYAVLVFPFLWTFSEYLRHFSDLAFNWINVSYTQTYYLSLIQFADITGYLGIVFWISVLNVSFYFWFNSEKNKRAHLKYASLIFVLFIIPLLYGEVKLSQKQQVEGISAGYVQPNIDPWEKWKEELRDKNMNILFSMTDSILQYKPDLVIWPETAAPFHLRKRYDELKKINELTKKNKFYLLTGTLEYEFKNFRKYRYNASFFFNPENSDYEVYKKMLLVPVEESIPFQKYSKFIAGLNLGSSTFNEGEIPVVFKYPSRIYLLSFDGNDWQISGSSSGKKMVGLASVICYESVFSNVVNRFYDSGANLMTVITNDGWFGHSAQPYQHIQMAIFRAIEHRTSIIHCANTGISGFIDPYGRIFNKTEIFTEDFGQKFIPLKSEITLYEKIGDSIGEASGYFTLLFFIIGLFKFVLNSKSGRNWLAD